MLAKIGIKLNCHLKISIYLHVIKSLNIARYIYKNINLIKRDNNEKKLEKKFKITFSSFFIL